MGMSNEYYEEDCLTWHDGTALSGVVLVDGRASGRLISSDSELSFWGGVDPRTGEIIDRHHALSGKYLPDTVLAIPGGRGSCSGSTVMLELLLNNKGPKAIIFQRREDILTLGVIVAKEIFEKSIPVVTVGPKDFLQLRSWSGETIHVEGGYVSTAKQKIPSLSGTRNMKSSSVSLTKRDQELLDGSHGEAARVAMRIILQMAELLGAKALIDISQVHIDACIYTGPGSIAVARKLQSLGGTVRVPTTMNAISVDQKRWKALGVEMEFGQAASDLANAYTDMGARPTFTCAPYQLDSAPKRGDQVGWGESNAVIYANSVLGAKTMKYPDFLDIAVALTGRAPNAGTHVEHNRLASYWVRVDDIASRDIDDSFWPLLGYCIGLLSVSHIPVITGLETRSPSRDDLKAFSAALGTSSSAPMFHMVGVTPEASTREAVSSQSSAAEDMPGVDLTLGDLETVWRDFNGIDEAKRIDLISLGNPHFSLAEIRHLSQLCRGMTKHEDVRVIVTCSRSTHGLATQAGLVPELEQFGVQFITDTCWCMIDEPVIPPQAQVIMTNSAKYAHYGPGLTGRQFCFGSLSMCVQAACQGSYSGAKPQWLEYGD